MNALFLAVLCLALSTPHLVAAQRCRAEDQVTAENPLRLTDLVRLLTVRIPESCGDFNPLQLLPCRGELNVVSGCCMNQCRDLFAQYTRQCLLDLTEVLCSNEDTAPAVFILNSIASRCNEDYVPLVCGLDLTGYEDAMACGCAPELDMEELEELIAALGEAENGDDSVDG